MLANGLIANRELLALMLTLLPRRTLPTGARVVLLHLITESMRN